MPTITLIAIISCGQIGQADHESKKKPEAATALSSARVQEPGHGYHQTKWRRWGDPVARKTGPGVKLNGQVIIAVVERDPPVDRPMTLSMATEGTIHRDDLQSDQISAQSARIKAVISGVHARDANTLSEPTSPVTTRATIMTVRNSRKGITGESELP